VETQSTSYLKGQFILAMPGLADPNFAKTVTCICEHTQDGAVGVSINRMGVAIFGKDLFEGLNIEYSPDAAAIPIYIGGPVHIGEIFILHGPPLNWQGSFLITPSLAMSRTPDILEAIATDRGPQSFVITLGCAGWGSGQLEAEIMENVWLISPIFEEIIFNTPVEKRWEMAVNKLGIDPDMLSNTAGHA